VDLPTHSTLYSYLKEAKAPQTLADAVSIIQGAYLSITLPSRAQKRLISVLRTVSTRVSEFLELPPDAIQLDELVEIDQQLVAFVVGRGVNRQSAVQYSCDLHKLLDLAHRAGWTSPAFELREAWKPILDALKGDARGTKSIVRFAIRKRCLPQEFSGKTLEGWKRRRLEKGRSMDSIIHVESNFRRMLRVAGLQNLFPRFSLASKNPPKYRMQLKDLPLSLRDEIVEVIRWKTADEDLADRDAALMIRPVTGESLQRHFVELYSYAVVVQGLSEIYHLTQLITEEIVGGFIRWLLANDRCKPQSVIAKLSGICSLTFTYPRLRGLDYSWFRSKLRALRSEAPARIQRRKLDDLPKYPSVAAIATRILALRAGPQKLTEVETAWLVHDALIFAINSCIPHRARNTFEACSNPHQQLGLFETEISAELVGQFKIRLPPWAEELRRREPRARFLVGHWLEMSTKAGEEVWEVFPLEVRDLFSEYMGHYHPILARKQSPKVPDSTRLFFAKNGRPLTQKTLLNLVVRRSIEHTNKRMRVKDFRDIVAAHMLSTGATMEEIAACLWHVDPFSGSTAARYYIAGFNASHGAAALEDEVADLI